jgi:hypothetical protein
MTSRWAIDIQRKAVIFDYDDRRLMASAINWKLPLRVASSPQRAIPLRSGLPSRCSSKSRRMTQDVDRKLVRPIELETDPDAFVIR